MSLLMKALEKAAKDRADARAEPATGPRDATPGSNAAPRAELTLEPLTADTPALHARAEPRLDSVSRASSPDAGHARARAASPAQAGSPKRTGIETHLRAHPIVALAVLSGVFLAGFGIYVYLQITNPGLFLRPAGPRPRTSAPVAQAPASSAPPAPELPAPLPAAQLAQSAPTSAPAQPEPAPVPRPQPRAETVDAKATPEPGPQAPSSRIVISRGSAQPTIPPLLTEAYAALNAGHLDAARGLYERLLRSEPGNVDALLGLADIAAQEGNTDEATKHYLRILELDPRQALAQAGLIAILGRADPLAAETRLKTLIAREPSPFLYFTLGNLYADQSLWAQAQQAYFQAYHLEPANPDYAYNLAIGLEHLSQSGLALRFYRRAVELAGGGGRVNFSLPQARGRIAQLASRME